MPVDLGLDREEEVRCALNFVQDHSLREVGDESGWIAHRCIAGDSVVEGDVAVPQRGADVAGERRLSALSRTVDEHDWRVIQGLEQTFLHKARVKAPIGHRPVVTLRVGQLQGLRPASRKARYRPGADHPGRSMPSAKSCSQKGRSGDKNKALGTTAGERRPDPLLEGRDGTAGVRCRFPCWGGIGTLGSGWGSRRVLEDRWQSQGDLWSSWGICSRPRD